MKTKILFFFMLFFVLTSCGTRYSEYKCPMECEKKTYKFQGECPVCGMELEGVELNENQKK